MNGKCVDKMIGKYCKIITKEPGEERANVVTGIVNDVDHESELIMIESLGRDAGFYFIKEIAHRIGDDYYTTIRDNMGINLSLMQLE